ncbi:unnamed protein product [Microthlaspi erraticum]|uniref:RRM domain-containing protein n=1 Tax=Microthlaspi erraticum TaxID=1685480 RepID=A0A6D2KRS2_9BRAS|nr:unnamed protein product [Microthlaspi erraticum]
MQLNGAKERDGRSRKRVLVVAEGFDVSVPKPWTPNKRVICLEGALRDHFSSCGKIKSVCIPLDYPPYYPKLETCFYYSVAYIEIWGDCAREKALQRSGSEINGHKIVVTAPSLPLKRSLRRALKSVKNDRFCRSKTVMVKGYDPSLPSHFIKSALRKHFSSCGEVMEVEFCDHTEGIFVSIYGEDAKKKALQLSGSDMEGSKLVVEKPPLFVPRTPGGPLTPDDYMTGRLPLSERKANPNWLDDFRIPRN